MSDGQVTLAERAVVHPRERDLARHVEPALVQRGEHADREEVVGPEDRVGPRAVEERLRRPPPRLGHEVRGDLDQRVVALEAAGAEAVEVPEPAGRARHRVLRAVDEGDPAPARRAEVPDGGGRALPRVGVDGVDGRPLRGPPDHDDRRGRAAELLDVVVGQVERGEDEAVDEAVLEIAHHRELVVRSAPVEWSSRRSPWARATSWIAPTIVV